MIKVKMPQLVFSIAGPVATCPTRASTQPQYSFPVNYDPFDVVNVWDSE
jgi:hypothetical protein